VCLPSTVACPLLAVMVDFPAFDENEVALLISAVERSLKHLRDANERLGGDDPELLTYGRRYSRILEKLQAVLKKSSG
jgi:hypothetical protein